MEPKRIGLQSLMAGGEASANVLACSFLLGTTMLIAYISKKYRWIYFPESSAALVMGMLYGALSLRLNPSLAFSFEPELFFYGLLPIIIFNAGYGLKKRDFFKNFATITLFAVVGTIVSALVYGLLTFLLYKRGYITHFSSKSPLLESLMFGSLISAIDPVATLSILQDVEAPTLLYNVVFGESLVNDASSIVLFKTFASFMDEPFGMASIANAILRFVFISVGSIILGVLVSLVGAAALKFVEIRTEFAKFELSLILVSAYLSYSIAEVLDLSGIMALFFCGICNAHYSYYSTTHAFKISSKYAFEALSFTSEMFVFAYLGMQVVVAEQVLDRGLLLSAIPLCLLSRAANIFPLAWLANRLRSKKISNNMKTMMWFSGLRGAIAFALSVNMPTPNPAIETTTLFIVVVTTTVFGGATAPMLDALGLASGHGASEEGTQIEFMRTASLHHAFDPETSELAGFHKSFKYIDTHYLKPLFGGQGEGTAPPAAKGLLEKLGDFVEKSAPGCHLKVPADWRQQPLAHALVAFASPREDASGLPEAEVDVVVFTVPAAGGEASTAADPASFLLEHWSSICPDLSPPGKEDQEALLETTLRRAASSVGQGFRQDSVAEEGGYQKLPGSSSRPGPNQNAVGQLGGSPDRTGEGASQGEGTPRPWSIFSQVYGESPEQQSPSVDGGFPKLKRIDSNKPAATSGSRRVIPAFVMQCDVSESDHYCDLFRYEIVAHPEERGAHKPSVRHYFLAVWQQAHRFFTCRVKVSEEFLFHGGIIPITMILDSFKAKA